MAKVFKMKLRSGKRSSVYYGKIRKGPNHWERIALYSDKVASARKLADIQREADQFDSGVRSAAAEKLKLPIATLRDEYITSLRTANSDAEHVRISEWMLNKLIELGAWTHFRDVTRESLETITKKLDSSGKTVSYQNKFVARARAFVRHWLPDGWPDPLRKLKRISEKGAKRNRGRRAATVAQLNALLTATTIPEDRKLAYALAALNGLRRNEARALTWERLHLSATIPFVSLSQKMGQDVDAIPLHPYIVKLLSQRMQAMPGARLLRSVPDVATLEKDWKGVGVTMTDTSSRLDYHALRHTFQTRLDQTGCSRATKKKLMRHAAQDVTDGYAHAELSEMLAALQRIASPTTTPQTAGAVKSGTTDEPVDATSTTTTGDAGTTTAGRAAEVDQTRGNQRESADMIRARHLDTGERWREPLRINFAADTTASDHHREPPNLIGAGAPDTVACAGPSTQVGYEESSKTAGNDAVSGRADQGADQHTPILASFDPDLRRIVAAWPNLPADVRARIIELARV